MRKNILYFFGLLLLVTGTFSSVQAGPGDTTVVRVHDHTHWPWYGNYYEWAQLPDQSTTYRKVLMHYTLGCPSSGCSEWDYTTAIRLREYTGVWDSTLQTVPDFTEDGVDVDSSCYALDTTFSYYYNSMAMGTDSNANTAAYIRLFEDANDPFLPTDSFYVWPANYWNYLYDGSGNIIDSAWVAADTCRYQTYDSVYNPFEVTQQWELGRLITPYAGTYPNSWEFKWTFDVTDFAPMLHDSVEINAWYGGWQDGWEITVDFEFIEGDPPRPTLGINRLWNGTFNYGSTSNPIENQLVPRTLFVDNNVESAMMRITTTGHSFGGAQNCAEFCRKEHDVLIGGTTYKQDLWRNDCDLNPLYPQGGTWIYDRAGWCPGSEVRPYDYEATPHITAGDSLTVDYTMESYTYQGGAGFHPNYIIQSYLFEYGAASNSVDAEIYNVKRPNDNDMNSRDNPICGEPVVVIRNSGTTPLTSLDITYGVQGGQMKTYEWTGTLNFMETEEVALPKPIWGALSSTGNVFEVSVSNPNGGSDEYADNDKMEVSFDAPPAFEKDFYLLWRTNGAVAETKYEIRDQFGALVYQNSPFLGPNTIYRDTFNLGDGCYTFRLYDTGEDGLSFFANNDGSGFARLKRVSDGGTFLNFNPDFGGEAKVQFTVGTELARNDDLSEFVDIYPNPTSGLLNVDLQLETTDAEVTVWSAQGQKIYGKNFRVNGFHNQQVDLSGLSGGIYLVKVAAGGRSVTKRIILAD